ncbi:hypothetical protein [Algibacter mikhailovii]|uniref:hypothetical protein n=1 Tax=Algibacter mikhailovii TaxID=425498 RepID=UPI0024944E86|nr:hypothetical protein [Algibacter mikhailovii]
MKVVAYILMFSLFLNSNLSIAQKSETIKNMFVRVYDLEGNKIAKGRIAFINDSVIGLRHGEINLSFFMRNIGKIKTKKSGGNNVVKGALIGSGVGVLVAFATDTEDIYSDGDNGGIIVSAINGVFLGSVVGAASVALKDSETFRINGDFDQWKLFKAIVVH